MEISINKRNRAICKRDPISPLNSPRIQTFNTVAYNGALHTVTKRLEICIDINIEFS